MAEDLNTAKREFWDEVKNRNPRLVNVEEFSPVLEGLIEWSERQPAIQFRWHEARPGSERQFLVKYCLPGMDAAFWAVYPKQKEGAFLLVLADPHPRFPDALRDEARRALAELDGRDAEPTEYPKVKFSSLLTPGNLQRLLALMDGWPECFRPEGESP